MRGHGASSRTAREWHGGDALERSRCSSAGSCSSARRARRARDERVRGRGVPAVLGRAVAERPRARGARRGAATCHDRRILELGCGAWAPLARRRTPTVRGLVATDWAERRVDSLRANAARNAPVEVARRDWREPDGSTVGVRPRARGRRPLRGAECRAAGALSISWRPMAASSPTRDGATPPGSSTTSRSATCLPIPHHTLPGGGIRIARRSRSAVRPRARRRARRAPTCRRRARRAGRARAARRRPRRRARRRRRAPAA